MMNKFATSLLVKSYTMLSDMDTYTDLDVGGIRIVMKEPTEMDFNNPLDKSHLGNLTAVYPDGSESIVALFASVSDLEKLSKSRSAVSGMVETIVGGYVKYKAAK